MRVESETFQMCTQLTKMYIQVLRYAHKCENEQTTLIVSCRSVMYLRPTPAVDPRPAVDVKTPDSITPGAEVQQPSQRQPTATPQNQKRRGIRRTK